eukprot:292585_1
MAERQKEKWSCVRKHGFKSHEPLGQKSKRKHKRKLNSSHIPVLNGSSNANISKKNLKQKTIQKIKSMETSLLCKELINKFKNTVFSNYKLRKKAKEVVTSTKMNDD